jgi:hypothetical protein
VLRSWSLFAVADEELAARPGVSAVPAYVVDRHRVVTGVRALEDLRRICGV